MTGSYAGLLVRCHCHCVTGDVCVGLSWRTQAQLVGAIVRVRSTDLPAMTSSLSLSVTHSLLYTPSKTTGRLYCQWVVWLSINS